MVKKASPRSATPGFLADESRPEQGVIFNGRVAEDFKLDTGTWVSVGTLRVKLVSAFAPYAQDVAITVHNRSEIGAMVFPSAACAQVPAEITDKGYVNQGAVLKRRAGEVELLHAVQPGARVIRA